MTPTSKSTLLPDGSIIETSWCGATGCFETWRLMKNGCSMQFPECDETWEAAEKTHDQYAAITIRQIKAGLEKVVGEWLNLYLCSECDFFGGTGAFESGSCYKPCPWCGGSRVEKRVGRSVSWVERRKWLPFLKRTVFHEVEWRDEVKKP